MIYTTLDGLSLHEIIEAIAKDAKFLTGAKLKKRVADVDPSDVLGELARPVMAPTNPSGTP